MFGQATRVQATMMRMMMMIRMMVNDGKNYKEKDENSWVMRGWMMIMTNLMIIT